LKNIFDKYKKNGAISFEYITEVYAGVP